MRTIAVDIDDVLSPFTESFCNYHNATYGSNLSIDDFKVPGDYWGYYEGVLANVLKNPDGVDEYKRRFWEYLETDRHMRGQPISQEGKDCLYKLKEHYNLEIVTARDGAIKQGTIEWIKEELPDLFSAVHFNASWKQEGEKITKAKLCQEIGADYIIDDSVEHCNAAAECGITAILFGEYGWNAYQKVHEKVIRVSGWAEVLDFFQKNY